MKFLKILTLSIIALLAAQATALAGSFKFSSPYPEIIFCSGGLTNPQFILSAKTYSTDYPLQVCLRTKDSKTSQALFNLDRYFTGTDNEQLKKLVFTYKGNPEKSIILIFSMLEKKCTLNNPCLLSDYQTDEFYFTIIKAYYQGVEFARDSITTPSEACFEEFYSAYLQDHPKQYLDAAVQSLEYCNTQGQKDEL